MGEIWVCKVGFLWERNFDYLGFGSHIEQAAA
jgi:hypothetical protein